MLALWGGISGVTSDIGIIDDPTKGAIDATSTTSQERVWSWYNDEFKTRLHNDSRILLTMTRWDKGDLAGRILASPEGKDWTVLVLEGVKDKIAHPKDPRKIGEALWENRHSLERLLMTKQVSERTFNALYQQSPELSNTNKIYPIWHICSDIEFDSIKKDIVYGLDFGFSKDALALIGIKVVEKDLYIKEFVYNHGLTNANLITLLNEKNVSKYDKIYADSASPDRIKDLADNGFNVQGAKKGQNSIIAGIIKMNEYRIMVCESSKNTQKEFSNYRYKEDVNGMATNEIVNGQDDHALDAIRYALMMFLNGTIAPILSEKITTTTKRNGYGNY